MNELNNVIKEALGDAKHSSLGVMTVSSPTVLCWKYLSLKVLDGENRNLDLNCTLAIASFTTLAFTKIDICANSDKEIPSGTSELLLIGGRCSSLEEFWRYLAHPVLEGSYSRMSYFHRFQIDYYNDKMYLDWKGSQ